MLTFDGIGCEVFGLVFEKEWNGCLKFILLALLFLLWPVIFLIGSIVGGFAIAYKCAGEGTIWEVYYCLPCCLRTCPCDGVCCLLYTLVMFVPWIVTYTLLYGLVLGVLIAFGLTFAALIYGILLVPTIFILMFVYVRGLYVWSGDCQYKRNRNRAML